MTPTYLQESHCHIILLQDVSIHGGPLQNQADDSPLIVEGIIHFLLFCTLWRLCVVSAQESRKIFSHSLCYLQRQGDRSQLQKACLLDYWNTFLRPSRKPSPAHGFWTRCRQTQLALPWSLPKELDLHGSTWTCVLTRILVAPGSGSHHIPCLPAALLQLYGNASCCCALPPLAGSHNSGHISTILHYVRFS